jgi:hypothetical protein
MFIHIRVRCGDLGYYNYTKISQLQVGLTPTNDNGRKMNVTQLRRFMLAAIDVDFWASSIDTRLNSYILITRISCI